jgi:flagellar hook-length control protein FliK
MQLNALTTSNISDKETKQIKNTVKGEKDSKKDFSLFLFGKNQDSKSKGMVSELEKELGKNILKNSKTGKSKEKMSDEEATLLVGVAKDFDVKSFGETSKKDTVEGKDFGNRIEGSKLKDRNSKATLDNLFWQKDLESSNKLEKHNLKGAGFVVGKNKNDKTISNLIQKEKLENFEGMKSSELKKELAGLYESKEKEAVDTGLKFKEIADNKEIIVTKGKSPQSRGRIYVNNEEKFINVDKKATDSSSSQNLKVSTSEVRKVDNDLKMVGKAGYGLKKFNGVNASGDDERKPIVYGTAVSLESIKGSDNFATQFIKDNRFSTARNDFEAIVEQVQNGIKMHFNTQLKEMKIKLQPEELGEVEVKLRIENNIMKAEFIVENQQVKEALESKFDTLKNNLSAKGFQGSEIDVYVSTGDRNRKETQEKFDFLADKKSGKAINSVAKSKALNSIDKQSVRRREIQKDSSLDIFI